MSGMDLPLDVAKYIDLSALKPQITYFDVEKVCLQALEHGFASVCINPFFTAFASSLLKGSPVAVCSVVAFPLGSNSIKVKVLEATEAIDSGASELDIVWNISAFKSGDYGYIEKELKEIEFNTRGVVRKVIVETGFLSRQEKEVAIKMLIDSGIDFIKTSTGFNTTGAKEEDILLFRELSRGRIKIKASGGIKDYATFYKMVKAGADRVGTSSGVQIVAESKGA